MKKYIIITALLVHSIKVFSLYSEMPHEIKDPNDFYVVDARMNASDRKRFFSNSVHFEWQQLSQLGEQSRGYLKKDINSLVADLAQLGLHPKKNIVIVGNALKGRGQEGRIAYTLKKLGFKKVFISSVSHLTKIGFKQTDRFPSIAKTEKLFSVNIDKSLTIEKSEISQLLKKNQFLPCIDVRPQKFPEEKINDKFLCEKIHWVDFFNSDLSVSPKVLETLEAKGLKKSDRIVVLSEAGLSSAGVLLALRSLEFKNAVLFEGGYSGLRAISQSLQN